MTGILEIDTSSQASEGKEILKGVTFTVPRGNSRADGANGSGKSTLSNVIAGTPKYQVLKGDIRVYGQSILGKSPDWRAQHGIFLGFQYGGSPRAWGWRRFLRSAYQGRPPGEAPGRPQFHKYLKEKLKTVGMDSSFLSRNLNEGFSGGEKKRAELLQMAVLAPRFAILDETDSASIRRPAAGRGAITAAIGSAHRNPAGHSLSAAAYYVNPTSSMCSSREDRRERRQATSPKSWKSSATVWLKEEPQAEVVSCSTQARLPSEDYSRYAFKDDIVYATTIPKGLSEDTVRAISKIKERARVDAQLPCCGPTATRQARDAELGGWLGGHRFRLDHLLHVGLQEGGQDLGGRPGKGQGTFEKPASPRRSASSSRAWGPQYDSEVVYHSVRKELTTKASSSWERTRPSESTRRSFKKFFGTIVPPEDNKFAALNSSVWSGGSFSSMCLPAWMSASPCRRTSASTRNRSANSSAR